MNQPAPVVLEPSGQVRDLSGARLGRHDPYDDAKELKKLHAFVGAYSRDTRLMAAPQGELGQDDVQTQGTVARSFAPLLDTIADIVCPVTLVSKTFGTWLGEDVAQDLAAPPVAQIAGTGSVPELNPTLASKAFDAGNGRALAVELPAETLANADLDLVKLSIRRLVNAFKLDREVRVAALLTASANWPSGNRTAAAAKWDGGVSPTPLADVFTALGKSLVAPTHLVMTEPAAQYFFSTQAVFQYLAAGGSLPQLVVAKLRKLTTGAADYVWGSATSANAILVYAGTDPEAISTARTFRYIGDAPDKDAAAEANGYLLRSFINERAGTRGKRSLVLACNDADAILSGQLGGIITGVLA